jgi:exodeoxyribonuclease X
MPFVDLPLIFLDVETTGVNADRDCAIQIGLYNRSGDLDRGLESFINPGTTLLSWAAMAVNHITPIDLQNAPSRSNVMNSVLEFISSFRHPHIVAFNAAFDRSFVPELDNFPWICAWRIARHTWPTAESYKNFGLYYGLELNLTDPVEPFEPHRALTDARVTSKVMAAAISELALTKTDFPTDPEAIPEYLRSLAESPIDLKVPFQFGKHRGASIGDVPTDYMLWALRNITDMETDLRNTLTRELRRRAASQAA